MDQQNPFMDLPQVSQPQAPPQSYTMGRPDPSHAAAEQREAARLRLAQSADARAAAADARAAQAQADAHARASASDDEAITANEQRANVRRTQREALEAGTQLFLRQTQLYRQNFEQQDPLIGLGWSPNEAQFDAAASGLESSAYSLFRVPGTGADTEGDALRFFRANVPSSTAYDTTNETRFDTLQERLNGNRRAMGLPEIDWRSGAPISVGAPAADSTAPVNPVAPAVAGGTRAPGADPNQVQPGESMGQVGNLPTVPGANDAHNELSNEGGAYITENDRHLAGVATALANSHLPANQAIAQINNLLSTSGRQPLTAAQADSVRAARRNHTRHPGFSPTPSGVSTPNLVTGMANSGPGAAVIAAGDALTFGTLDNMTADPEGTRAAMELSREQHPWESLGGDMAGSLLPGTALERLAGSGIRSLSTLGRGGAVEGVATRLPGELSTIGEMAARPTGDALYGAGYGAGSADQNGGGVLERLQGAGRGAAFSAAGGEIGSRFASGAGRVLTGIRDAGVQALSSRGVPMTIGQMTSQGGRVGRFVTTVENALESLPVLGDAIRARRMDSFQGANRAAFDEALAPIGGSTGGIVGEEGVDRAKAAVSAAYDEALGRLRVGSDDTFRENMSRALDAGARLPDDLRSQFNNFVRNRLGDEMVDGELSGAGYQALRQELREDRAAVRGQLAARRYSNALRNIEDALEGLVRRQAPDAVPALNAADRAYRRTRIVEGAVGRGINNRQQGGVFTPAQLGTEAKQNANRFGNDGSSTNRPFYESQREAQNILPAEIPNSGTADRAWVLQTFPALVGGTLAASGVIDPKTAALLGAFGLPYTRRGQREFQRLLTQRPEVVRQAGEALIRNRNFGAAAGAGALNPETDQTPDPTRY